MSTPGTEYLTPAAGDGSGRVRRSVGTWITGLGATAAVALAGFIATPLLVRWLGDSAWGAWTVVGEWLGYLGISQLAFGPGAASIFLLRAHSAGTPGALTAMARRWFRLYCWAAVGLLPAGLALAWWAPQVLHPGPALARSLQWAVGIAAVGSVVVTPALLLRNVLDAAQRGYLVRGALLAQSLTITGLSLLWVAWGWGLVGMAAATVCGLLLGAGLWAWAARRWLPGWRSTAAAEVSLGQIWHYNWPLIVAMLGNQINVLTDNTVVGLTLGAAAVTGFALTQTLPLLAGNHLADIGGVSWAALGDLRARGDARFATRVIELSSTVLGMAVVLMATIGVVTPAFVQQWVGAQHFAGAALSWATVATMVVFSFICFFAWLVDTQGDTRRRLGASTIGSALNLGLSLVLVRHWGVAGVAVGTLVAYLATDAWYLPYLVSRQYGVPERADFGAFIREKGFSLD